MEESLVSKRYRKDEVWEKYVERNRRIIESVENELGFNANVSPNLTPAEFADELTEKVREHLRILQNKSEFKMAFTDREVRDVVKAELERVLERIAKRIVRDFSLHCGISSETKAEAERICEPPDEVYCPFCEEFVEGSDYLRDAFSDDYFAYWISSLVTHYRHYHIRYYDRSWRYWGYGDKNPEYKKLGHDGFKILVNNRAKRQIIRRILKDENISSYGKRRLIKAVLKLQYNDEKTIELVKNP